MSKDIVDQTARKLGMTPEGVLRKYADSVTRTNANEVYDLRLRQYRAGYIHEAVENFCLNFWRKVDVATPQLARTG